MIIFGTAGHIDHGKTALIYALTDIDADRLPEEKKRGMTIDLGFAWLEKPSGEKIGIIDVPGHENFIRNMIIGMTSVDAFILVVDAKEGWKPQTEEHFQIIRLLNIDYGMIVITKTDLVSSDRVKEVKQEIEKKIYIFPFQKISISSFNTKESDRLYQLREHLEKLSSAIPEKKDIGKPRLFIDRVFDIKGSGTVVTGTLVNGNLEQNQYAYLFPLNRKVRLRQLQSYGSPVEKALIGSRVAINISGVKKEELHRGDLIYGKPGYQYGKSIDVRLVLPAQKNPYLLKSGSEVDFISHTRILRGRVIFGKKELKSGEQSYAQIRFLEPLSLMLGDYFIIRLPGVNETIGGGRILDPKASRHSFNKPLWNEWLDRRKDLDISQVILTELQKYQFIRIDELLVNSPYSVEEIKRTLKDLADKNLLFLFKDLAINSQFWINQTRQAIDSIQQMHQDYLFKESFPIIQLKNIFSHLPDELFDALIDYLAQTNKIRIKSGEISSSDHSIKLSAQQKTTIKRILEYIEKDPEHLPTKKVLQEEFSDNHELIDYLIKNSEMIVLEEQIIITPNVYCIMKDKIVDYLKKNGTITIAQVRDLLNISRKYIVPLLTKMDDDRLTVRRENTRILKQ